MGTKGGIQTYLTSLGVFKRLLIGLVNMTWTFGDFPEEGEVCFL